MAEAFDQQFLDHQNREAELQELEDADRAKEIDRQIAILEPFHLWLASEFPKTPIGAKITHDYTNAFFEFGEYYVGVSGDDCITDAADGIVEWIYQRFLDQQ